jgi:hypothetical protein
VFIVVVDFVIDRKEEKAGEKSTLRKFICSFHQITLGRSNQGGWDRRAMQDE